MIDWIKNNRLISALIFIGILFYSVYIYQSMSWILYPNSTDYGEGFVMNYAKLWANGTWKWDISTPPYLTMVYGVGYPVLVYPLVKLFGATLWLGRMVSFSSAIITSGLIYLIVKELTGKKIYGAVAALLPATQAVFRDWSYMARVDMPAVMFSVIGVYIAVKYRNSKWLYLAIIPFIVALMIKLSVVAGMAAVVVYLLIHNRQRLLVFAGLLLVGLLAIFIPMMIVSGGEYWKHIFVYQNTIQNINVPLFSGIFSGFITPFVGLLLLSLIYVRRRITIVGLYFVAALVIGMLSSFRSGAAGLYYFEAIMAGSICATLALPYLWVYFKRKSHVDISGVVIAVVSLVLIILPLRFVEVPKSSYTGALTIAQNIMSDTQKPIITENPALSLKLGREIYVEPFIFTNLARLGYWNEATYINQYKEQYFDYILLRLPVDYRIGKIDGNFTVMAIDAINQNYTLVYKSVDDIWLYSMYLYEANNKLNGG
jgi:4-amino-4-deoxy-L-arabinose transferase-like glycosyltransferase